MGAASVTSEGEGLESVEAFFRLAHPESNAQRARQAKYQGSKALRGVFNDLFNFIAAFILNENS